MDKLKKNNVKFIQGADQNLQDEEDKIKDEL